MNHDKAKKLQPVVNSRAWARLREHLLEELTNQAWVEEQSEQDLHVLRGRRGLLDELLSLKDNVKGTIDDGEEEDPQDVFEGL